MRGHTVTTCWWHRLCTTQVHTEKKNDKQRQSSKVSLGSSALLKTAAPGKDGSERLTLALVALLSENPPEIRDRHGHTEAPCCDTRERRGHCASPDELLAVETEGGLPQVGGHELVSVDLVDPPPHGAVALPGELLVRLLLHRGLV